MTQETAAGELRDLKPLEPYGAPEHGGAAAVLGAGLLLAAAALATALLRRRRRRLPPAPAAAAARDLAALARAPEPPDEEFYRRLAAVVRTLLGARLGIPAAALSAAELGDRLEEVALPEDLGRSLSELFRYAEDVVYGRQVAGAALRTAHLAAARRLLDLPPRLEDRRAAL